MRRGVYKSDGPVAGPAQEDRGEAETESEPGQRAGAGQAFKGRGVAWRLVFCCAALPRLLLHEHEYRWWWDTIRIGAAWCGVYLGGWGGGGRAASGGARAGGMAAHGYHHHHTQWVAGSWRMWLLFPLASGGQRPAATHHERARVRARSST